MLGHYTINRSYQLDWYSCGAHCTYMIARHFGCRVKYATVKAAVNTTPFHGTRLDAIIRFFRSKHFRVGFRDALHLRHLDKVFSAGALVIAPVGGNHVVVVHGVDAENVYLADPHPLVPYRISRKEFSRKWDHYGLIVYPR